MAVTIDTQRTGFYMELSKELQEQYLGLKRNKFLPMVDNLYFTVSVGGDSAEVDTNHGICSLVEELVQKKAEMMIERKPIDFAYGLTVTPKVYGQYAYCITEVDLYDIFFCKRLPNNDTPRIVVQLRAFGLWTRGMDSIIMDAYNRLEALLADYHCTIVKCGENRIDYCYHTNAISSPSKIFSDVKGRVKYLDSNLDKHTTVGRRERVKDGTILHKDYVCFGSVNSKKVRARIYDKVKEVVEVGYKSFFFKIWRENGLISYYDNWCMEYAFPHRNMDYLYKAAVAFYVQYGADGAYRRQCEKSLANENTTLVDFKRLAESYMPKITVILNIEYETKRKYYYYSDGFIDSLKLERRHIPKPLERIYKIYDYREIFIESLTKDTLSFHKGKGANGELQYVAWWQRLRNTKIDGIKLDEKLLRDYSCAMDKAAVVRRGVLAVASSAVYDDSLETGFIEDISDFLSNITDNQAHEMGRNFALVDLNACVVVDDTDLPKEMLAGYRIAKTKKDKQLKNRKKRRDNPSS